MEARQKAHEFIKDCGFKIIYQHNEMIGTNKEKFNATVLARFLKQHISEVVEKYIDETGQQTDIIHWRIWWESNNVRL